MEAKYFANDLELKMSHYDERTLNMPPELHSLYANKIVD